jgi:hypothetical protein
MAEKKQTKKTTTKKTENKEAVVDVVKNKVNIEEQINNVDTEIKDETDGLAKIEKKISDEIEPVVEITKEVNDIVKTDEELVEKTNKMTKEELVEFTKEELEKANEVKEKIEKIIPKRKSNSLITNWWNGTGFGY